MNSESADPTHVDILGNTQSSNSDIDLVLVTENKTYINRY